MSREFKFRVYSFVCKEFIYFDIYDYPQGIAGAVSEPQQYTGLKDSKGNPIYEGDIVKFDINVNGYVAAEYLNKELCTIQFGNCEGDMAFIAIHVNPVDLDNGIALNTRFQEYMTVVSYSFYI